MNGGDVDIALLQDEDACRHISCLLLLILWQTLDVRINQKDIRQIIELLLVGILLLIHVAVEADISPLIGVVCIRWHIQYLRGKRSYLVVVDAERALHIVAGREVLEEVENS